MKKGVAVQTIVWIVLAIIVLGLVGYLLFTTFVKGKAGMESKECLAARLNYCLVERTPSSLADVNKACAPMDYTDATACEGLPSK